MAQTSTAITGCDIVIKFKNLAGLVKDISGSSNQVTLTLSQNSGEGRTFG